MRRKAETRLKKEKMIALNRTTRLKLEPVALKPRKGKILIPPGFNPGKQKQWRKRRIKKK